MKKIVFVFICFSVMLFASCSNAQGVDVTTFETGLKNNVQLLDVRTPGEYRDGHLKGAILMDINDENFEKNIGSLDKERPVYVYCHSGRRSHAAAGILKEKGFKEVVELKGGIEAWKEAGRNTESTANPK